nr:unnamed protein product [Digitaria exilis]
MASTGTAGAILSSGSTEQCGCGTLTWVARSLPVSHHDMQLQTWAAGQSSTRACLSGGSGKKQAAEDYRTGDFRWKKRAEETRADNLLDMSPHDLRCRFVPYEPTECQKGGCRGVGVGVGGRRTVVSVNPLASLDISKLLDVSPLELRCPFVPFELIECPVTKDTCKFEMHMVLMPSKEHHTKFESDIHTMVNIYHTDYVNTELDLNSDIDSLKNAEELGGKVHRISELLDVSPRELRCTFVPNEPIECPMTLANGTDHYVSVKVADYAKDILGLNNDVEFVNKLVKNESICLRDSSYLELSELLDVYPRELCCPFVPDELIECPMTLTNRTVHYVGVWITPATMGMKKQQQPPPKKTCKFEVLMVLMGKTTWKYEEAEYFCGVMGIEDHGWKAGSMYVLQEDQDIMSTFKTNIDSTSLKKELEIDDCDREFVEELTMLNMDGDLEERLHRLGCLLHRVQLTAVVCDPARCQEGIRHQRRRCLGRRSGMRDDGVRGLGNMRTTGTRSDEATAGPATGTSGATHGAMVAARNWWR